jgi:hypothetical protein
MGWLICHVWQLIFGYVNSQDLDRCQPTKADAMQKRQSAEYQGNPQQSAHNVILPHEMMPRCHVWGTSEAV